jgi:hypothetical protein
MVNIASDKYPACVGSLNISQPYERPWPVTGKDSDIKVTDLEASCLHKHMAVEIDVIYVLLLRPRL